jgi:putative hydrolase
MAVSLNQTIAGRLNEVAAILAEQGANRFRVEAYRHAAASVRGLAEPVAQIFAREGLAGLEALPGVGESIARAIRDLLLHGRLALLDRLRGEHDPLLLLESVPGIGRTLARKLHENLGLDSLVDLETAAHDGRLEIIAGLGAKRLAGIRDSLAHRLGRTRPSPGAPVPAAPPSVTELLDVDREYRAAAAADQLKKIAPLRFNPTREAWLPILHTSRGPRHYTALFSNTAHAHAVRKTTDWVLLYYDGADGEHQCTVITSEFGGLKGQRIVRGREHECEEHYQGLGQSVTREPCEAP